MSALSGGGHQQYLAAPPAAPAAPKTYTVKAGDTLSKIAKEAPGPETARLEGQNTESTGDMENTEIRFS